MCCSYPYITFIYNICYMLALFWLLLLYVGTDELLKVSRAPIYPLGKFCRPTKVLTSVYFRSLTSPCLNLYASRL